MKNGSKVKWVSQSSGIVKEKVGTIVKTIYAGVDVRPQYRKLMETYNTKPISCCGEAREHKSFLVAVDQPGDRKPLLYWPVVSGLVEV